MPEVTRPAARLLSGTAAALLAGAGMAVTAGSGDAASTFRAVASATASSAQYDNPAVLPLGAVVEVAGQTAQATIDQLGTSAGFASHPYPGGFVVGTPGLANGAGSPVPVPDYPFFVASDAQVRPEARTESPGFVLESLSQTGSTTAKALGAVGDTDAFRSGRGVAEAATSLAEDGSVVSRAVTEIDSIAVAGVLRLGRVSSDVTVTRSPSGELTRASTLEAEAVSVAGQRVGLVDGQLVVADTTQPLPASPLGDALAQAGITISEVEPTDTEDGRTGGALVITVANTSNEAGTSTATYRLGGAAAFISFGAIEDFSAVPDIAFVPPAFDAATGSSAGQPPSFTATQPGLNTGGGVPTLDAPSTAAPEVAAAPDSTVPTGVARLLPRSDAAWLYFAFIVSAVALAYSAQIIRQFGVKARA